MSAATTVDQLTGCTPARAAEVVTALADHHARHWDGAGLDRAPWRERFADSVVPGRIADAVDAYWPGIRTGLADELTPAAVSLGDGLAAALPRLAEDLSRPPITLAHGDLRLDNLFFDEASGVRACDWQLTARSRGVRDLAYFLTQSMTPDDRAAAEADLVALYLERLASQDGRRVRRGDGLAGLPRRDDPRIRLRHRRHGWPRPRRRPRRRPAADDVEPICPGDERPRLRSA